MTQADTSVYRPAGEFQPNDEVLSVSVRSTGTWKCARMSRDQSHLVSVAGHLHSRVVSWTRADVLCNARSPLPVNKSQTSHDTCCFVRQTSCHVTDERVDSSV